MFQKFILLVLILCCRFAGAQQMAIGKVTNESGGNIAGVAVYNMRTEEHVETDAGGLFAIRAMPGDELRFVLPRYSRWSVILKSEDLKHPLGVLLSLLPKDIETVEIAFNPTGNLKKDVKALDKPIKYKALNNSLSASMKTPPNEVLPTNTIPSAFKIRKPGDGQIPLFGISSGGKMTGILGAIATKALSKNDSEATLGLNEKQKFFTRIKNELDLKFFYQYGLDEYALDRYLAYLDRNYNLAKKYARNFNRHAIENILHGALKEYLKTAKNS